MIKRFYNYILSGYTDSSIEIRKKVKLLLSCSMLLLIILIPIVFIMVIIYLNKLSLLYIILSTAPVSGIIISLLSIILIKHNNYNFASILIMLMVILLASAFNLLMKNQVGFTALMFALVVVCGLLFVNKAYQLYSIMIYFFILLIIIFFKNIWIEGAFKDKIVILPLISSLIIFSGISIICIIIFKNTNEVLGIARNESEANKKIALENQEIAMQSKKNYSNLTKIIDKVQAITVNLNSSSLEIESAAQEQTSGSNEQASGVTEVSATLEELSITAKQITKNTGELVFSSGEVIKSLQKIEEELLQTISKLDDVGKSSTKNTAKIGELSKRSVIITEMVELIKAVANKTNILSINASIEASRNGEAGTGFAVVASEIRELSKETIVSAKNVEMAARDIQDFLNSIVISSESESVKVIDSGKTVKNVYENIETIVGKINNNYSFTQKIDVSIKQQESGSKQAADTMKQMAEISRQSAEIARQTLIAVKDIVNFAVELDQTVMKIQTAEQESSFI